MLGEGILMERGAMEGIVLRCLIEVGSKPSLGERKRTGKWGCVDERDVPTCVGTMISEI